MTEQPYQRRARRRPRGRIDLDKLGMDELESALLYGIPALFVVALFLRTTGQDPPTVERMWASLHGWGLVGIIVVLGLLIGILVVERNK